MSMDSPLLLFAWRRHHTLRQVIGRHPPGPDVLLPNYAGTHACMAHVLFSGDHRHPA